MQGSHAQREDQTTSNSAKAHKAQPERSSALKVQLRAMSFAQGAARLDPTQAVQRLDDESAPDGGPNTLHDEATMKIAMERIEAYSSYIANAAKYFGVSERQIKQIIATESTGNKDAVSSGTYKGLMQVDKTTWDEACKLNGLSYDFASNWNNAEINIFVGTAAFLNKAKAIEGMLAKGDGGEKLKPGAAENADPFDKNHPDFAGIAMLAFNGGQSTVVEAMKLAGSTKLADITQPVPLKAAIKKWLRKDKDYPWQNYMGTSFKAMDAQQQASYLATPAGIAAQATAEKAARDAQTKAIDRKYDVMVEYPLQCQAYGDKYAAQEAAEKAAAEKKAAATDSNDGAQGEVTETNTGEDANASANTNATSTDEVSAEDHSNTGTMTVAQRQAVAVTGQYRHTTLALYAGYAHTSPELAPAVKELETLLAARRVSGEYGQHLELQVKMFQEAQGLPATGRCDPVTWSVLLYRHAGHQHEALPRGYQSTAFNGDTPIFGELRQLLAKAGHELPWFCTGVDQDALDKVNAFRASCGLAATETIDSVTWAILKFPPTK